MRLSAPVYQLKRHAKLLARNKNIPLHDAQDIIAREEGFASWSLLSARLAAPLPAAPPLAELDEGDMFLIGARPGQGKTMLGLQLLLNAAAEGRRAMFFTLEYTQQEVTKRIQRLDKSAYAGAVEILTSDDISADTIIQHMSGSPRGAIAVIDYLQILDQQRTKPALPVQLAALKAFAGRTGAILGFISQIDRSFQPDIDRLPGPEDIRAPNPFPDGLFSKACFLHAGTVRLDHLTSPSD